MDKLYKYSLFILALLLNNLHAQSNNDRYSDLDKYIPYNLSTYKRFPIKTINVKVHVIQFSEENPMNVTTKDSNRIRNTIEREVNYTYSNLEPPTLKSNKPVPEIRNSRIQFKVNEFKFHIDPELISPEYFEEGSSFGAPWEVDSIDLEKNELRLKKNLAYLIVKRPSTMDSLYAYKSNGDKFFLHFDSVSYQKPYSLVKIKENLHGIDVAKVSNNRKISRICSNDLFLKYAVEDSSAIHIFLVNSFDSDIMGGCGPSALFMKVGNWNYGDGGGTIEHEIGHCMGLYHTNSPQFDDLPIKDKLCSGCNCDSTTVSNNIMGYNWCKNYLSPKQIAYIYKEYNTNPIKIRTTTDCTYDPKRTLIISKDLFINRNYVYGSDVIVKKNKTLEITEQFSLPKGAHIYLEKGSTLIVNGGEINNACGEKWNGIKQIKRYKKKKHKIKLNDSSDIIVKNGGSIENHITI